MRPSSIVAFMLSSTLFFIGCYSERLFEGHSTGSPFHGTMQANKAVDIWPWSLNPLDGRGDGMAASVLPWLVAAQIGIALARRALVLLVQCVRKREAAALLTARVMMVVLLFVNVVPVAAATAAPFEVHSTATSRRVDGLAHAEEPRGNATARTEEVTPMDYHAPLQGEEGGASRRPMWNVSTAEEAAVANDGQQAIPQAQRAATHGRDLLASGITVSSGDYPDEVGWTLSCSDGSFLSGIAPYTGSLDVAMGSSCTLSMTDSYGNGWEGATWMGFGQSFTLATGASEALTFSIMLWPPLPPSLPPSSPPLSPPPSSPPSPPSPPLAPGATWVYPGVDTLQAAVNAATPGDVLVLADGTYTASGGSQVFINGTTPTGLTIRAANPGQAVLDAQGVSGRRGVTIDYGSITIEDIEITGGNEGGVAVFGGTATFNGCTIRNNQASYEGGGVYVQSGTATFNGCTIRDNQAANWNMPGGGVFVQSGTATFNGCTIRNNQATNGGGLYQYQGTVHVLNTMFIDNSATAGCDVYVGASASAASEFVNNTFADHGSRTSCTSGNTIRIDTAINFRCALGMWAPFPGFLPIMNFTGCPHYCPAGYFGATDTLTTATCSGACSPGTYCPEGSTAETECPTGTYLPPGILGMDVLNCIPCNSGTYSNQTGLVARNCTAAPPGTYVSSSGQIEPSPCPVNTFASDVGSPVCTACPTFSTTLDVEGASSIGACTCLPGYYQTSDASLNQICSACPEGSTTSGVGAMDVNECICDPFKYKALDSGACVDCMGGVDCSEPGGVVANLKIRPGYWRPSNASLDVRRCPDATIECDTSASGCPSGCRGGRAIESYCGDGSNLAGPFCLLCKQPAAGEGWRYRVKGRGGEGAKCELCEDDSPGHAVAIILAIAAAATVGLLACPYIWARRLPVARKQQLRGFGSFAIHSLTLHNKLKILIGFYLLASPVPSVYDVSLPRDAERFLERMATLTLNVDLDLRFECLGMPGLLPRLLFWSATPAILVLVILCVSAVVAASSRERYSSVWHAGRHCLLLASPSALRLLFLIYPTVTRQAFRAFPCYEWDADEESNEYGSYLRADVGINCGSAAYRRVGTVAVATIAAYSVGCFAGFAVLLARARPDKHPNRQLSLAICFLHSEYRPEYFFWELMEMLRRFVLVGVFVVIEQGSVEQLAYATLFSIVFGIVQAACAPYRMPSDNAMALGCSLALSVLFVICMIYKYGELTDLDDVQAGMTSEQKINYAPPYVSLSFIALACCVGAFIMLGASTFIQLGVERRRKLFEARAAKARRLRWGDDGTEVFLGALIIPEREPTDFAPTASLKEIPTRFHLFLSHVWGTGQDQMRIIKQRLLEMLPDIRVFLDVDDLREGKGAEYVDASGLTLIFLSDGYFTSPNCLRELLRAALTKKPILALFETERKHGALTRDEILEQLRKADAKYELWGLSSDVKSWGYDMPTPEHLYESLFLHEPIEWTRIGAFQDVTMRVMAEALLPTESLQRRQGTFLQGELVRQPLPELSSTHVFHVYCSPFNAGAAEAVKEAAAAVERKLVVSESVDELPWCGCMLIYLNGRTWTSGDASEAFAKEVARAMKNDVKLLLCHEMEGLGGQEARHGCLFDIFFSNPNGAATPQELLQKSIYSSIATPLKGGPWRPTSMAMLWGALVEAQLSDGETEARSTGGGQGLVTVRVSSERLQRLNSVSVEIAGQHPASPRRQGSSSSSLLRLLGSNKRIDKQLLASSCTRSDAHEVDERAAVELAASPVSGGLLRWRVVPEGRTIS